MKLNIPTNIKISLMISGIAALVLSGPRVFNIVVGAIFLGVFGWFLVLGIYHGFQSLHARHWATTDGKVLTSELEVKRGAKGGRIYRASVQYQYRVNDGLFTGTRVFFGDHIATSFEDSAIQRVARYFAGANVTVFYDPLHPEQCVIEKVPWPSIAIGMIGITGLLLFALMNRL
jgi:hypothetical protein